MNVMKLVKLIYLLDRLSIQRRGIPVVGGRYFSMRNGPVPSEVLDLVNNGTLLGETDDSWERFITDRDHHDVGLTSETPQTDELSEVEMELIAEVWREHGEKSQFELADWCHRHCREWTPLEEGRAIIQLADIAREVGFSPEGIKDLEAEARALAAVQAVLQPRPAW